MRINRNMQRKKDVSQKNAIDKTPIKIYSWKDTSKKYAVEKSSKNIQVKYSGEKIRPANI